MKIVKLIISFLLELFPLTFKLYTLIIYSYFCKTFEKKGNL